MATWEDKFESWSQGPGKTESDKCDNAETSVRKAVFTDPSLSKLDVTVFAQGSYRARTNVTQDSDVDICVRYNGAFFERYPEGKTRADFGNVPGALAYSDFKNMVEKALRNYFGSSAITRGNKAFDVHANTYRIDADVVPTFEFRFYTGSLKADRSHEYYSGVAFYPDSGSMIINWPQQTYDNGVERNDVTSRRYKRIIRILKRLRNAMQDNTIEAAKDIQSFLIECLVWNAPIEAFDRDTYTAIVRHVIADVWNRTREDNDCSEWGEVNELKYLFRSWQPWSRKQANLFLDAAWNYIGFK